VDVIAGATEWLDLSVWLDLVDLAQRHHHDGPTHTGDPPPHRPRGHQGTAPRQVPSPWAEGSLVTVAVMVAPSTVVSTTPS
jgi:hypothetical protein